MWQGPDTIHITECETEIIAVKGGKSQFNFKVQYKSKGKRIRTPKHIHLVIDLLMKKTGNRVLTLRLINHILDEIIMKVASSSTNPPTLQVYDSKHSAEFMELNSFGEYPIDFLLIITEMIMIQEKTNYPDGTLNLKLFKKLRDEADIFSIVSSATFRGGK